jgi:hypothetical protein
VKRQEEHYRTKHLGVVLAPVIKAPEQEMTSGIAADFVMKAFLNLGVVLAPVIKSPF